MGETKQTEKKREHRMRGFYSARIGGKYVRYASYREFRECLKAVEKKAN